MQRGSLLQPLRSTELVLSGPPRAHPSGCVQPFRLRRAQPAPARALARQRASSASSSSLVPLHRRSKPTRCLPRSELRSAAVGRVFLSAFAPQKPHSFPRGKPPASGPLPPSANTPHPFSPKLSRFRAGSFVAAETAPAPRFSQSLLWGGSLQSRARRKPELGYSQGFSLGPALPFTRNSLSSPPCPL